MPVTGNRVEIQLVEARMQMHLKAFAAAAATLVALALAWIPVRAA